MGVPAPNTYEVVLVLRHPLFSYHHALEVLEDMCCVPREASLGILGPLQGWSPLGCLQGVVLWSSPSSDSPQPTQSYLRAGPDSQPTHTDCGRQWPYTNLFNCWNNPVSVKPGSSLFPMRGGHSTTINSFPVRSNLFFVQMESIVYGLLYPMLAIVPRVDRYEVKLAAPNCIW